MAVLASRLMRFILIFILFAFHLSAQAQTGFWNTPPFVQSPSYRVRWDAEVRVPKTDSSDRDCAFDLHVAMLESDDTLGARVQALNRSTEALDIRVRPGEVLKGFLQDGDSSDAFQDFYGMMPAGQVFSLLWGFTSPKEKVLQELSFDFFVEAKSVETGEWQCRRRVEIVRIREGIVYSRDPFYMGLQLGTTALRTGDLGDFGSKNTFAWGIEIGGYGDRWGGVLALEFHDYGGGGARIKNEMRARFPAWAEPQVRSYDAGFLISRRFEFENNWSAFYDAGLGLRTFQYGDDRQDRLIESQSVWGFQHRGSVLYRLRRYQIHPFNKGSVFMGFTLSHHVSGGGDVISVPVGGQSLTGLFQFKFSN